MPCNSAQRREPSRVISCGVRIPATTSSPCALTRYSPLKMSSPVAASRVKATPVADVSPMLPNTIACTVTAVPHSAGMLFSLRYRIARSFIQLLNTAQMAPQSCSHGLVGNSLPVFFRMAALKRFTSSFRSSVVSSVSFFTFFSSLIASMISSNGSTSSLLCGFMSITTSPYICTKRRYESHAKRALPVFLAMPSTASSFRPRFRIVSIIPGIEARAPERTDSKSGFVLLPNSMPMFFSTCFMAASTSGLIILITSSLPC